MPEFLGGSIKNYLNPDVDILWLNIDNGSGYMFENIHVRCGRHQPAVGDCNQHSVQERPSLVRQFAMNYYAWLENKKQWSFELLQTLERLGVAQMFIVVGDTEHIGIETDTVFIRPQQSPAQTSKAVSIPKGQKPHVLRGTWWDNEKKERQYLLDAQAKYLPELKEILKKEKFQKEKLEKENLREKKLKEKREEKRKEKLKG